MDPAAFRVAVGMSEREVRERFTAAGVELQAGEEPGELVGNYEDGKTVTIHFRDGRVDSLRFELVDFLPLMTKHWEDVSARLKKKLGAPTTAVPGADVLIWQENRPNVIAALSRRRDDRFGEKGLGFVVIRYFEPPAAAARAAAGDDDGAR